MSRRFTLSLTRRIAAMLAVWPRDTKQDSVIRASLKRKYRELKNAQATSPLRNTRIVSIYKPDNDSLPAKPTTKLKPAKRRKATTRARARSVLLLYNADGTCAGLSFEQPAKEKLDLEISRYFENLERRHGL